MKTNKSLFTLSLLCVCLYSSPSSAERVEGPGVISFSLGADDKKLFKINLKVDKVHRFIGAGKGGQVDYFVYDANGTGVANDMEMGSDCNIEFTPKLPGYYYFLAKNYSDDSSTIVIRTN